MRLSTSVMQHPKKHAAFHMSQFSHLDAFDAEAEVGGGADALSPLHVSRLEDRLEGVFFWCRGSGIHADHLLVQVLRRKQGWE